MSQKPRPGTYAAKRFDVRWQKRKAEILARDSYRCTWCGFDERDAAASTDNLADRSIQVHHGYYGRDSNGKRKDPWDYPDETLYSLCNKCHERAEQLRQVLFYELGRIHPKHHTSVRTVIQSLQSVSKGGQR